MIYITFIIISAFSLSPSFCFTYCFHLFIEEKKADPENGDTGRVTYSKHFHVFSLKFFDLLCSNKCVP